MSLWSYGWFFLGVVLGGVALLVIFSLLAMAQKGDAYQERLECELRRQSGSLPPEDHGAAVDPDLGPVSADPPIITPR